jgi:hypothetical protein
MDGSQLEMSGVWEQGLGAWGGSMDILIFYIIFYSSITDPHALSTHPLHFIAIYSIFFHMSANFYHGLIACLNCIKWTHWL